MSNSGLRLRTKIKGQCPFRLKPTSADHLLTVSGRLDVLWHGLDEKLVMLHRENLPTVERDG